MTRRSLLAIPGVAWLASLIGAKPGGEWRIDVITVSSQVATKDDVLSYLGWLKDNIKTGRDDPEFSAKIYEGNRLIQVWRAPKTF